MAPIRSQPTDKPLLAGAVPARLPAQVPAPARGDPPVAIVGGKTKLAPGGVQCVRAEPSRRTGTDLCLVRANQVLHQ